MGYSQLVIHQWNLRPVDDCGNSTTCSYTITVRDALDPIILCPSSPVIACNDPGTCTWTADSLIAPFYIGENCPDITISYSITGATTAIGNGTAEGELMMIGNSVICYTILDAALNSSMCCFSVDVRDCDDPVLTCPEDVTVECDGAGNMQDIADFIATASVNDNCDMAMVPITSSLSNTISDCGKAKTLTYLFQAIDEAGNEFSCVAGITIEDTTPPAIDLAAANLNLECDPATNATSIIAWLNNHGGAVASEICNPQIIWSHDYDGLLDPDCGSTGSKTVNFTVTDLCGNQSVTSADIVITDSTPPSLTCPTNIELQCADPNNDAIIQSWLATAFASDICDPDIIIMNDYPGSFAAECGLTGVATVTFTATDICGNESMCMATITFVDNDSPEFDQFPQDTIVECDGSGNMADLASWLANNGGASASDDCDPAPDFSNSALPAETNCGNTSTTTYVFTATDDCGNTSSSLARFVIEDTTPPALSVPAPITVECDGLGNATAIDAWIASATSSDICDIAITVSAAVTTALSDCGDAGTFIYTFTATDACGNTSTATSEVTIEDTTPPSITCPIDLILECGDPSNNTLVAAWLSSAITTDDCGNVSINTDFDGVLPTNCGGSVSVTFTALDDCGNPATCIANIVLQDTTPPNFLNCPIDTLTVNADVDLCGANVIYSTPIALDQCDTLVQVQQTLGLASGTEFPIGTTEIQFVAMDDCGNSDTCFFVIEVVDTDVPTILCPSNDIVVNADPNACTWTSPQASISPSFTAENCPLAVTYEVTGATVASGMDDASGTIFNLGISQVCYTITETMDLDGNGFQSSICCFQIIVQDNESPNVICPLDVVLSTAEGICSAEYTWNHPDTSDNCSVSTLEVGYQNPDGSLENPIEVIPGMSISRTFEIGQSSITYIITDGSGNTNSCTWTVTVEDNEDPMISCIADTILYADMNCTYTQTGAALDAMVTDNCSDFELTHDYAFAPNSGTLSGATFPSWFIGHSFYCRRCSRKLSFLSCTYYSD